MTSDKKLSRRLPAPPEARADRAPADDPAVARQADVGSPYLTTAQATAYCGYKNSSAIRKLVHEGKLTPIPQGFFLLAPTSIEALRGASVLSWAGKLRVARELFIKARTDGADESLASFMERRFGREALDRIAQPMVAGIAREEDQRP